MRALFVSFLLLLLSGSAMAQVVTWEDFAEDWLSESADEGSGEDEEVSQTAYEELLELHQHPFNVNRVTREDLLRLPFLSPIQADTILVYVRKHKPLLSLEELRLVRGLDAQTAARLALFLWCGPEPKDDTPFLKRLAKGRQEIATVVGIPFYRRAGYHHYTNAEMLKSPNKYYFGSPLYSSLRYRYKLGESLNFGLTMEKDAGEPFAARGNHPFDSYSYYAGGKGKGWLHAWALGDYHIHVGLGLTAGSGFFQDGLALTASYSDRPGRLSLHRSTDEQHFLRGGASVMTWRQWTLTTFVSMRNMDATMKGDSVVTSFKTDGYHRTEGEREKQARQKTFVVGGALDWTGSSFYAGVSAVYTGYHHPLSPGAALYRRYYLSGKQCSDVGLHYGVTFNGWKMSGEVAMSSGGALAALHTLRWSPMSDVRLFVLHRYYSYRYSAPNAFAYCAGGRVQNESGIVAGATMVMGPKWNASLCADFFHHPWATFRASSPSDGGKLSALLTFTPDSGETFLLRYRLSSQEQDNASGNGLERRTKHRLTLQGRYLLGPLSLATTVQGVLVNTPSRGTDRGWMVSQRVSALVMKVRLAGSLSYFCTDSYSALLSSYEPSLMYVFSFSSFYYHGLSTALTASCDLGQHLNAAMKYVLLCYTNRETISSGPQLISGPSKNDLSLQLRYFF